MNLATSGDTKTVKLDQRQIAFLKARVNNERAAVEDGTDQAQFLDDLENQLNAAKKS